MPTWLPETQVPIFVAGLLVYLLGPNPAGLDAALWGVEAALVQRFGIQFDPGHHDEHGVWRPRPQRRGQNAGPQQPQQRGRRSSRSRDRSRIRSRFDRSRNRSRSRGRRESRGRRAEEDWVPAGRAADPTEGVWSDRSGSRSVWRR